MLMSLMAFLNFIPSLFIFITIFILPIYSRESCKSSKCNTGGLEIRFPFVVTSHQDITCGYPGFDLTCSQGLAAIDLPLSGRFFIREIDYKTQVIKLYDPNNCLPGRILQLNLSGSPFMGNTYRNYSFFSCPVNNMTTYWPYIVNCLSNSTNIVMAVYVENVTNYMVQKCDKIVTVPVPVPYIGNDWFSSNGFNDLWLTWYGPRCEPCERDGGTCGLKSVESLNIVCLYRVSGWSAIKIVLMAVISPAIALLTCCLMIKYTRNNRNRQDINNSIRMSIGSITLSPQLSITTERGLDYSTIQSYTKVVIGESKQIPGLNDGTCPICLSEFVVKETVRCIPDCTHCFHSDCIDEWLRLNPTCPVCRSSPIHNV